MNIELVGFADMGISSPEETGLTLRQNAMIKASHGFKATGLPTAAEDTGLFVDGLDGMPGVFSARFAGPGASYQDNRRALLHQLKGLGPEKRRARFAAVVAFTENGRDFRFFRGEIEGFICDRERGDSGFGYDPVFVYPPMGRTLAQLEPEIKNKISHRAKVFAEFRRFLLEGRVSG